MPDHEQSSPPLACPEQHSGNISAQQSPAETTNGSTFVRDLLTAIGLLTAGGLTILKTILGLETGTVVVVLLVIGAVAAVIVVLAPHITTRARAIVAVVGVVFVLGLEAAAGALLRPDLFAADRITGFLQACHHARFGCEISKQLRVATEAGDVRVFGVTSYTGISDARGAAESGLVITDTQGTLKWQRTFSAGWGIIGLDTDSTGHISNHLEPDLAAEIYVLDGAPTHAPSVSGAAVDSQLTTDDASVGGTNGN